MVKKTNRTMALVRGERQGKQTTVVRALTEGHSRYWKRPGKAPRLQVSKASTLAVDTC